MATYTAKEAAERLPELLGRATAGEDVVIAQSDGDRVRLVPDERDPIDAGPVTQAEIEWLRANRLALGEPVDFTALIREMRDESP
ncbi:type II toxin-antitoxin system Phd/YefM family antitoxin [Methylobacterium sp. JK268]